MLVDVQIRKAKPAEKPYKLTDGGGLHLYVTPAGGRFWRLRYLFAGREKLLSIGPYPDVSLDEARDAAREAKTALRAGRDPGVLKKLNRQALRSVDNSFEAVAREWHALQAPTWAPVHAFDVLASLERDVFPILGSVPIADLTPPDVLAVLRPVERRGAVETARRLRQRISAVCVYAIASGRAANDPAAVVAKAMAPLVKRRQPAITDLEKARRILADVENEAAHPVTKLAHRLLAITAVRPGTLITTPWEEWANIDASLPLWTIPSQRMKLRAHLKDDESRDHLVPLPRQAIEAIAALRTMTGRGPLAFPNTRHAHKPLSENAIGYLLNRAGYHSRHVPHGWRSTFSTVLNERFKGDRTVIDLMLAHVPPNTVEGAYNRAEHLQRRRELAQIWADLVTDGLRPAEDLLAGPRRSSR